MTKNSSFNSKISSAVFGIILVWVGVVFLAGNIFHFLGVDRLWPLFLLAPAVLLVAVWLQDRDRYAAALLPVTILVFFTIYFLWLNFTTWSNVEITWPNFLIGPGLGFFVLYFTKKRWGFLLPALILILLATIFYAELIEDTLIVALILIGVGIALVARSLLYSKEVEVSEKD